MIEVFARRAPLKMNCKMVQDLKSQKLSTVAYCSHSPCNPPTSVMGRSKAVRPKTCAAFGASILFQKNRLNAIHIRSPYLASIICKLNASQI